MGKETCIFSESEKYLKELYKKYKTGGIWIVKKYGKRYSFVAGIHPSGFQRPTIIDIDEKYSLFCENGEYLQGNINEVILKLKEILNED